MVGGPVQPDRPCYVERTADRRLDEALRAKRLVLRARRARDRQIEPPASRGACATRCRRSGRDGRLAADYRVRPPTRRRMVGCAASPSASPAELELDVDVGAWWSARDAIAENRLVEFFWEVVLTNTTAPIVVLVDEVEAALELPFAADFLDAVGGCYERRSREPDFARLSFVLAGCTSQRALAQVCPDSAFAEARGHRTRRLQRRAGVSARRRVRRRPRARASTDGSHLRVDRRPSLSDAARRARRRP